MNHFESSEILNKEERSFIEMSIEASNEVRVKDELIDNTLSISAKVKEEPIGIEATLSSNKPNKITNNKQSIKHEREFIPISDSKRTREDISSDDQPNKRRRESISTMKVKVEPTSIEIQRSKEIGLKTEEEEKFSEREEFTNKTSIAFLNEETNNNQSTDSNNK